MNAFDYFFEKSKHLNKPFIVGSESISFEVLYNSTLLIAKKLHSEIGQKQHIVLISDNNVFFIKSYLSILKSGNICIPIDPGIEKENFSYILGITRPKLIFATKNISQKLPLNSSITLDPGSVIVENNSIQSDFNDLSTNQNDCAEILFTSGSTGRPKGVMLSHKNLISNTSSILSYLNLNQEDRMLVVLPFYYCYGLSLLHTHLRTGGSLVLNNSFMFLGNIIRNLIDYNCTGFAGVPSHFQILLRKSDSFKKNVFPSLRYVTQAGGHMATALIDEFVECFPDVKFYVMYGQTEATARLSFLPPEMYTKKKGSIGKGIPGVELRVVDENGKKVKTGETGEIIARGSNIMLGYYNNEDNIENIFKDDWLFTGDMGTIDNDGYIYLISRKKEIIKVGGKRVSPKEIEAVILQVPEVIDCIVLGIEDELTGEAIKAKIVIKKSEDETSILEIIKRKCNAKLAIYKIPKVFEFSTHFSINQTGKIKLQ